jgi:hypothetical protein
MWKIIDAYRILVGSLLETKQEGGGNGRIILRRIRIISYGIFW